MTSVNKNMKIKQKVAIISEKSMLFCALQEKPVDKWRGESATIKRVIAKQWEAIFVADLRRIE